MSEVFEGIADTFPIDDNLSENTRHVLLKLRLNEKVSQLIFKNKTKQLLFITVALYGSQNNNSHTRIDTTQM